MIRLEPFTESDFSQLITWIDSPELLVTIAGYDLTYPLTKDQLEKYLKLPDSIPFKIVSEENRYIGHAELVKSGDDMWKIDKLLIAEPSARGHGIGTQVINALVRYASEELRAKVVELNVFEWNIAGIRCYTKAGFKMNEAKRKSFEINGNHWVAVNMIREIAK